MNEELIMCDVHLDEIKREYGVTWHGKCSFCEEPINGKCDVVYGTLDDGSPGLHVMRYHPDCLDGIEFDGQDENDGCFSYGVVTEILNEAGKEMELCNPSNQ